MRVMWLLVVSHILHFTNGGGNTSECSAKLVCCALLLKSDVMTCTLNILCFLCALRLHYLGIRNVHDLQTLENSLDGTLSNDYMHCYITLHLHFIDLSVRRMAVDVKPVVYYNSLLMSSHVIVTHRTHSLNNKR
jgi:hypothetical protein